MKKHRTKKEILRQQMELLAEESKRAYPANDNLSQKSLAMAQINKEILKNEWLPFVLLIANVYILICIKIHRK